MSEKKYISIAEFAKILGISRIAVYKKIKKGEIKSIKVGRSYAISRSVVNKRTASIIGKPLKESEKRIIEKAVRKTVEEYGDVLKKLGNE